MIKDIVSLIRREIAPLRAKLIGIVSRGTIEYVDDSKTTQAVQVSLLSDEVTFNIEHVQPFGFSSVPVVGADAVHLCIGGSRTNAVACVVSDDRYRPTGNTAGTVCLHTQNAVLVRCLPDGNVELGDTPTQYIARADKVATEINALKDAVNALITAFNSHTHTGVTSGGSSTAGPSASASSASATTASNNACTTIKGL